MDDKVQRQVSPYIHHGVQRCTMELHASPRLSRDSPSKRRADFMVLNLEAILANVIGNQRMRRRRCKIFGLRNCTTLRDIGMSTSPLTSLQKEIRVIECTSSVALIRPRTQ